MVKDPKNAQRPHEEEAGDHEASDAESEQLVAVVYPENIHKRVNALKNIHMEIQKLEQQTHVRIFLAEAELQKRMAPLLAKRAEIVSGKYEPDDEESSFKLKEDQPAAETTPSNGQKGIPEFWLGVLRKNLEASSFIQPHDEEVLAHLADIRVVYSEKPLGFKLEFEFSENPFFSDQVLSRTYGYDENVAHEDLYLNSGLTPKTSSGSGVNWKDGKNLTRKVVVTSQRNKKTKERREVKSEVDQETFFQFFTPEVADLSALTKMADTIENATDAEQEKIAMRIHQAETEYEFACTLRSHIIPRALLLFTGEEQEDQDYSDEEDYEDEDDDEAEESEEEDSSERGKKENFAGKAGKKGAGGPRKTGKHGEGCCGSDRPHKH